MARVSSKLKERKEDFDIITLGNDFVKSRYKLSLNTQKFFLYSAFKFRESNSPDKEMVLYLSDFSKVAKIDPKKLYREIELITDELMNNYYYLSESKIDPSEVEYINGLPNVKWTKYSFVDKIQYDSGVIRMSFASSIKPFILNSPDLDKTDFILKMQLGFKGKFTIKLYQLLKMHLDAGQTRVSYHINDLKTRLGLEADQYPMWAAFESKVLGKSNEQINSPQSDIRYEYDYRPREKVIVFDIWANEDFKIC